MVKSVYDVDENMLSLIDQTIDRLRMSMRDIENDDSKVNGGRLEYLVRVHIPAMKEIADALRLATEKYRR